MLETFCSVLSQIFGDDLPDQPLPLYQVATRTAAVYVIGLALVRIGKSRLIGRSTTLDVISGFILGSLLSRGITGSATISGTAVASAALVAAHWALTAIAFRSHAFGNLIKGHSYVLVEDGRPDLDAMRRSHITEQDLLEHLRLQGEREDIGQVARSYKERSGEVSFIMRKSLAQVIEVKVAEGVQTVRIELAG